MVPIDHARLSVRAFAGKESDYLELHKFIDQTKLHFTDYRHRMFLHNPLGISLCEQVFGNTIENSDGNFIPVRELARRHIVEDCGCVPTLKEWADAAVTNSLGQFNHPSKKDIKWLKKNHY